MELWIARDKDGTISLTNERPTLSVSKENWLTSGNSDYIKLSIDMFPEVTFENSPKKVKLKLVGMIDKACKWIKENIDAYSKVVIVENSIPTIELLDDFEINFHKAMEE